LPKQPNVSILDVPAIFAQMNRNAVCAAKQSQYGRGHRVRFSSISGLPDRRDMIDIHA
jgi:hypothetical protein